MLLKHSREPRKSRKGQQVFTLIVPELSRLAVNASSRIPQSIQPFSNLKSNGRSMRRVDY